MEEGPVLLIQIGLMAVFGIICAAVASGRGRSAVGWFFIGLFFGCLPLIILLVIPDLKVEQERHERLRRENARLRERVRMDRDVSDRRHGQTRKRLGTHDRALGLDTAAIEETDDAVGQIEPPPPPANEWYYAVGEERLGPVSWAQLRKLWRGETIDRDTLVWTSGMADWLPVGETDVEGRLDA